MTVSSHYLQSNPFRSSTLTESPRCDTRPPLDATVQRGLSASWQGSKVGQGKFARALDSPKNFKLKILESRPGELLPFLIRRRLAIDTEERRNFRRRQPR